MLAGITRRYCKTNVDEEKNARCFVLTTLKGCLNSILVTRKADKISLKASKHGLSEVFIYFIVGFVGYPVGSSGL